MPQKPPIDNYVYVPGSIRYNQIEDIFEGYHGADHGWEELGEAKIEVVNDLQDGTFDGEMKILTLDNMNYMLYIWNEAEGTWVKISGDTSGGGGTGVGNYIYYFILDVFELTIANWLQSKSYDRQNKFPLGGKSFVMGNSKWNLFLYRY